MPVPRNYLKARAAMTEVIAAKPISITNEGGHLRVNLYGEIGMWGINATDFVRDFGALDPGENPVHVHINSPGGDVYDGLAIYQTLKMSPANIHVHIDGLAASAASFIAMAGDVIEIGRNSRMMVHDASTITYGNAQDHEDTAEWLNEESDNISDIYAQRSGGTAENWRETMRAEQWYSGAQAVEAGLADNIEGSEPEDKVVPSVAASIFNHPDGRAVPVTRKPDPDPGPDFEAIAQTLKGVFTCP